MVRACWLRWVLWLIVVVVVLWLIDVAAVLVLASLRSLVGEGSVALQLFSLDKVFEHFAKQPNHDIEVLFLLSELSLLFSQLSHLLVAHLTVGSRHCQGLIELDERCLLLFKVLCLVGDARKIVLLHCLVEKTVELLNLIV